MPKDVLANIPAEQVAAAIAYGWDNATIQTMAKTSPQVLEDLVAMRTEVSRTPEGNNDEEESQTPIPGLEGVSLDKDAVKKLREQFGDEAVDTAILPLANQLNSVVELLNNAAHQGAENTKTEQVKRERQMFNTVNSSLDSAATQFPELGVTNKLPKLANGSFDSRDPAVQVRSNIFAVASAFMKAGKTVEASMSDAIQWYRGSKTEAQVEKKLVDEALSFARGMTPKPVDRNIPEKPLSPTEQKVAVVRDALTKAGIKG
jgi:hypothetical protein